MLLFAGLLAAVLVQSATAQFGSGLTATPLDEDGKTPQNANQLGWTFGFVPRDSSGESIATAQLMDSYHKFFEVITTFSNGDYNGANMHGTDGYFLSGSDAIVAATHAQILPNSKPVLTFEPKSRSEFNGNEEYASLDFWFLEVRGSIQSLPVATGGVDVQQITLLVLSDERVLASVPFVGAIDSLPFSFGVDSNVDGGLKRPIRVPYDDKLHFVWTAATNEGQTDVVVDFELSVTAHTDSACFTCVGDSGLRVGRSGIRLTTDVNDEDDSPDVVFDGDNRLLVAPGADYVSEGDASLLVRGHVETESGIGMTVDHLSSGVFMHASVSLSADVASSEPVFKLSGLAASADGIGYSFYPTTALSSVPAPVLTDPSGSCFISDLDVCRVLVQCSAAVDFSLLIVGTAYPSQAVSSFSHCVGKSTGLVQNYESVWSGQSWYIDWHDGSSPFELDVGVSSSYAAQILPTNIITMPSYSTLDLLYDSTGETSLKFFGRFDTQVTPGAMEEYAIMVEVRHVDSSNNARCYFKNLASGDPQVVAEETVAGTPVSTTMSTGSGLGTGADAGIWYALTAEIVSTNQLVCSMDNLSASITLGSLDSLTGTTRIGIPPAASFVEVFASVRNLVLDVTSPAVDTFYYLPELDMETWEGEVFLTAVLPTLAHAFQPGPVGMEYANTHTSPPDGKMSYTSPGLPHAWATSRVEFGPEFLFGSFALAVTVTGASDDSQSNSFSLKFNYGKTSVGTRSHLELNLVEGDCISLNSYEAEYLPTQGLSDFLRMSTLGLRCGVSISTNHAFRFQVIKRDNNVVVYLGDSLLFEADMLNAPSDGLIVFSSPGGSSSFSINSLYAL